MNEPLVEIRGLTVSYLDADRGERAAALRDIDLTLAAGRGVGLTGQSGGGKSTLSLAIAGLLPASASVRAKSWRLFGKSVVREGEVLSGASAASRIRHIAAGRMFFISQDARASLVPYHKIAWHLRTAIRSDHQARALERLRELDFHPPEDFLPRLPAQLSTGQCQRIQLALALELSARRRSEPFLLLADEPCASVDPALVGRFAERLRQMLKDNNGLLLVTHQLDLLRETTAETQVVYEGAGAEAGPTAEVLSPTTAVHWHTRLLLELESCRDYSWTVAAPTTTAAVPSPPVISTENLCVPIGGRRLRYADVSIPAGSRFGLSGPSGCGKTTLARALMGLVPAQGRVTRFAEKFWADNPADAEHPRLWRRMQLVQQDTDLAFDPGGSIGESLVAAYQVANPQLSFADAWAAAGRLCTRFHLPGRVLTDIPGRVSGGQRKRLAIARGLAAFGWLLPNRSAANARLLILDEPTVGVDVFLQGIVAKALLEAQRELGLTYLVISHDQRFLERFCNRIQPAQLQSTACV